MLKLIVKFLKVINSNAAIGTVAYSMALGALMAQYPSANIQWIGLLVLVLFIFKMNFQAFLLSFIVFGLIPAFLHPAANAIGNVLLANPAYKDMWTELYNSPFGYLTGFYNTVILGMTALFIPAFLILFILFLLFVKVYREKLRDKVAQSKPYKVFVKIPLISKMLALASKLHMD